MEIEIKYFTGGLDMARSFVGLFLPMFFLLGINIAIGLIAVSMAKKRGLRTIPAFFVGFFGSFLSLFFIAMFPIKESDFY